MIHQQQGAEKLSEILNDTFEPLIDAIYDHGGMVVSFTGDAFTALFKSNEKLKNSIACAIWIQRFIEQNRVVDTLFGRFEIRVKIGIGCGDVEWNILGTENHFTYMFRGEAIQDCVAAENFAQSGQIIASLKLADRITPDVVFSFQRRANYLLITDRTLSINAPVPRDAQLDHRDSSPFMPRALQQIGNASEFRKVIVAFISFKIPENGSTLNNFIKHIITKVEAAGGFLKDLDFGDKGAMMVLVFGATSSRDDNLSRAVDFLVKTKQISTSVTWRASVTTDSAYIGFIGQGERKRLSILGNVMTLAARIVIITPWDSLWIGPKTSDALRDDHKYRITSTGHYDFKGFDEQTEVFRIEANV